MTIKSITVLLSHGADKVFIKTDFPCPYVLAYSPEQTPLQLDFEASYDTGVEYVRRVFGVEPEIINVRN